MEHLLELTFTGTSRHKVDGKGRVSIPAEFRRVLEAADPKWAEGLAPTVYIQFGEPDQAFLECFSANAMNEIRAKVNALPLGSPARIALDYLYSSCVTKTSVDETGRLVLSAERRNQIGVEGEAMFVANGTSFKIMAPAEFDRAQSEARAALAALPQGAHPLSLLSSQGG